MQGLQNWKNKKRVWATLNGQVGDDLYKHMNMDTISVYMDGHAMELLMPDHQP